MPRERKKEIAVAGAPHSLFRRITRRRRAAPLKGADQDTGDGIRELLAFLGWLCGGALAFLRRLGRATLAFLGWLWDGAVGFVKGCRAGWVSFVDRAGSDWRWWWRRCRENGLRVKGDEAWPVRRPANLEPRSRTGKPSEKSDGN